MIPGLARYLHTVSVAFDELEGRCKPFTDLIPDFGNELTHATYKQFQEHLQENKQIKPYNYNDYLQIVRIFGNSISNNASTMEFLNPDAIHNYQPILPTQSILYFTRQNVGFWIQVEQYKQVKENFQDCRRILESMWESVNFTASPPCLTDFRNLFFPSQREIDQFEKTLADDIYSLLMKEIGTDLTRDYFKTEFFHFLYRPAFSYYIGKRDSKDGATEEPIRKSMQGLFPSIVFFLDLCKCQPGTLNRKGIWYKWVPRAMLSIESQIMLECCTNLLKEYPNMFLTTLHDCIKCLPKDVEKVQEELERTFAKYHVSPKFEKQEHKRKSNLNS